MLRLCDSLLNVLLVFQCTLNLCTMLGPGTLQQFGQLFHSQRTKPGFASLVFHWIIASFKCVWHTVSFYVLAPSVRIERTTSSLTVKRNYRCATRECSLAVRLRLELRNRLSPIDGLAIHSNTIMGPHLKFGSPAWDRTTDTLINSQVQLPLCYWGMNLNNINLMKLQWRISYCDSIKHKIQVIVIVIWWSLCSVH